MSDVENKPNCETPTGGQGEGSSVLGDEHHTRADLKLLGTAVKNRWNIPGEMRELALNRMRLILEKQAVRAITKMGPEVVEGPADSNAVQAAKVLVAMDAQNQADEQFQDKKKRLDEGKPTEVFKELRVEFDK